MTDRPCVNCLHSRDYMTTTPKCRRPPSVPHVVYGTHPFSQGRCARERQRTFCDLLFGRDKCGPEGRYFEEHPVLKTLSNTFLPEHLRK